MTQGTDEAGRGAGDDPRPGQPMRRSRDDTRPGTASLFAALDRATGQVMGECYPRYRAWELRQFLDTVEARVPRGFRMLRVWDNDVTHKTALIRDWLAKRPRWQVHPTPASRSRLNQIERFCLYDTSLA